LAHSKTIYLEVRMSNHAAIQLYDKHGFNEMSIRKDYYRAKEGREDAVLMGLEI
jgi:ribosomal-protein-alanine N-acetyltransferase